MTDNTARLTITHGGQQGDLPDLVPFDSSDDDVRRIATESVRSGYVPGIDAAPHADFRDFVVDRFAARGDLPFNWLSLRPKLLWGCAVIIIVGVGALGSHAALVCRNLEHTLKLVDFDRVEQKNTLAQFHTKMGLGRNKASSLGQALQGMFGVKTEVVPHRLTADNAEVLLGGADLVLDCTDNIAARMLIQQHCRAHGLDCLHGALAADGSFARIVWDEEFVPDAEGAEGEATCVAGEHLPFFAATAAYLGVEAQRFLTTGKKMSFQLTPAAMVRLA